MAASRYNGCFTCSLTGDESVGKTAFAVTKANKEFPAQYEPTIFENYAADFIVGSHRYLLGLFDNASQPCYEPLRAFAYEKSDVFLLCYSVAKRSSFNNIKQIWAKELVKYVQKRKNVLLIGLQVDLRTNPVGDYVSTEEGTQLAVDIGAVKFLECSALTKVGFGEVFEEVMRIMISSKKKRTTFGLFRSLRQQVLDLRTTTCKAVCRLLSTKPVSPKKSTGKASAMAKAQKT